MNILFIIHSPGGSTEDNTIALVPSDLLTVNLERIHNKIVNVDKDDDEDYWTEQIIMLYKRFGLEKSKVTADLIKYLNPRSPFIVDKVVFIGWSI